MHASEQVRRASANLLRALADQVPGAESFWARSETADDTPGVIEVAREPSLVIAGGSAISVRIRWYDVNVGGWVPDHALLYVRTDPPD